MRPLFEFELMPVEEIVPWGSGDDRHLSWYALTDGHFRIHAGSDVLFQYSEEFLSRWPNASRYPHYMVVAFARDILECVTAGQAPLPPFFESLICNFELVAQLQGSREDDDYYTAWRWLGERSPWFSYLRAYPEIRFIRSGADVQVQWDNRICVVDGVPVWMSMRGSYMLPVETFVRECRDFADRLLARMEERIDSIEGGTVRPQMEVSVAALREQHEQFRREFAGYLDRTYSGPDIPWDDAEAALRAIAARRGIAL